MPTSAELLVRNLAYYWAAKRGWLISILAVSFLVWISIMYLEFKDKKKKIKT